MTQDVVANNDNKLSSEQDGGEFPIVTSHSHVCSCRDGQMRNSLGEVMWELLK